MFILFAFGVIKKFVYAVKGRRTLFNLQKSAFKTIQTTSLNKFLLKYVQTFPDLLSDRVNPYPGMTDICLMQGLTQHIQTV